MIPILALLSGTFTVVLFVERLRGRTEGAAGRAGRLGLAALFVMTGISHFIVTEAMAQMVPPPFPPVATVWTTGVLEILGAIGLLVPRTSKLAAWCLFAFLIAIFPANIYAAINHTGLGGHLDGLPICGSALRSSYCFSYGHGFSESEGGFADETRRQGQYRYRRRRAALMEIRGDLRY